MADIPLDEMMADLRRADAAGDTALAQHIASRIRAAQAQPAQASQPQDGTGTAPQVSGMTAFGRGAAQGATLGFGDEISGLIQAALPVEGDKGDYWERYRRWRDAARHDNSTAQEQQGGSYFAGNILGGLAPAVISGGAGAAPSAARAGLAMGGATGLGDSTAEDPDGAMLDVAKGMAFGAAGGKLMEKGAKAVQALPNTLRRMGTSFAQRALNGGLAPISAKVPLVPEVAENAVNVGALRPLGTVHSANEVLEGVRERLGNRIGSVLRAMRERGIVGPDAEALAAELEARGIHLDEHSIDDPQVLKYYRASRDTARPVALPPQAGPPAPYDGQFGNVGVMDAPPYTLELDGPGASKLLSRKPLDENGNIPLDVAERMKRRADHVARNQYDKLKDTITPLGELHQDIANTLRQANDTAIEAQAELAPDLVSQWRPLKHSMGLVMDAHKRSDIGSARAYARGTGMLTKLAALGGLGVGMTTGDVNAAAALPLAVHMLETRGPSTGAWAAFRAAQALDRVPPLPDVVREAGRRYAPSVLINALNQ